MLETKVITEVLIKQGEVASLTSTFNENEYVATITPQKIALSQNGHRRKTRVAEYNRGTENSQWYLSHCCGAQGFGLDIDDKCHGKFESFWHDGTPATKRTYEYGTIVGNTEKYNPRGELWSENDDEEFWMWAND